MDEKTQTEEKIENPNEKISPNGSMNDEELIRYTEMNYKALLKLVEIHIYNYASTFLSSNKTNYQDKVTALRSMSRALIVGLDHGINLSQHNEIIQYGHYAKTEKQFAGTLAQLFETKLILMGKKLDNEQKKQIKNEEGVNQNGEKNNE